MTLKSPKEMRQEEIVAEIEGTIELLSKDALKQLLPAVRAIAVIYGVDNLCPVCKKNPIAKNRDGCCVDCSH